MEKKMITFAGLVAIVFVLNASPAVGEGNFVLFGPPCDVALTELLACVFIDLIDASCLARWICTAVRRNVAELDLSLGSYNPYQQQFATVFRRPPVLELPRSLFRCTTLVRFKLLMDQKLRANNSPPTSNGFPSLKFLHVTLHYANFNSIEKLISCCGAFEDLTIDGDIGGADSNLNISAPKVKRLQLSLLLDQQSSSEINCQCWTSIDANVPSLEELGICYDFLRSYYRRNINVNILNNVKLDFKIPGRFVFDYPFLEHADRVRRLSTEISHVKHLSISTYMLMVLGSNNTGFTRWPDLTRTGFQCLPPAFSNLKRLELQLVTVGGH